MRWNCPHCGIALAISDEKLGAGWSFSRCYKCSGFALIRPSDMNLIKVDHAPPGSSLLAPETTAPEAAGETPLLSQRALENLKAAERPVVKPATRRAGENSKKIIVPPPAPNLMPPGTAPQITRPDLTGPISLPSPLPEISSPQWQYKMLPIAIALAAVTAVGSGIYLYIEGQNLWSRAKTAGAKAQASKPLARAQAAVPAQPEAKAEAVASNHQTLVDQVRHEAMAPVRKAVEVDSQSTPLTVEVRVENAKLREGPGLEFEAVGTASEKFRYIVSDWKHNWFKIVVPGESGTTKAAWIRNDLVQLYSGTAKN